MSLFKERQASAKKVISLNNEILSLRLQLEATSKVNPESNSKVKKEVSNLTESLKRTQQEMDSLKEANQHLKADLKRSKSEATRLKSKIITLKKEQENVQL
jgi:chromosome segregation ATPase